MSVGASKLSAGKDELHSYYTLLRRAIQVKSGAFFEKRQYLPFIRLHSSSVSHARVPINSPRVYTTMYNSAAAVPTYSALRPPYVAISPVPIHMPSVVPG